MQPIKWIKSYIYFFFLMTATLPGPVAVIKVLVPDNPGIDS